MSFSSRTWAIPSRTSGRGGNPASAAVSVRIRRQKLGKLLTDIRDRVAMPTTGPSPHSAIRRWSGVRTGEVSIRIVIWAAGSTDFGPVRVRVVHLSGRKGQVILVAPDKPEFETKIPETCSWSTAVLVPH